MSKEVERYTFVCDIENDEYVRASDYEAFVAERDALSRWKKTAEYWYGQYRLVKHGESPEQYPTEGKLDDWHKSYHTT